MKPRPLAFGLAAVVLALNVVGERLWMNAGIASQTALGRVGLPDDIGGAISMLLQSDNRWVNAQRIEVAGGMHI